MQAQTPFKPGKEHYASQTDQNPAPDDQLALLGRVNEGELRQVL